MLIGRTVKRSADRRSREGGSRPALPPDPDREQPLGAERLGRARLAIGKCVPVRRRRPRSGAFCGPPTSARIQEFFRPAPRITWLRGPLASVGGIARREPVLRRPPHSGVISGRTKLPQRFANLASHRFTFGVKTVGRVRTRWKSRGLQAGWQTRQQFSVVRGSRQLCVTLKPLKSLPEHAICRSAIDALQMGVRYSAEPLNGGLPYVPPYSALPTQLPHRAPEFGETPR